MDTRESRLAFKVRDLPLRLFHWLLVAALAVAFLSAEAGETRSGEPRHGEENGDRDRSRAGWPKPTGGLERTSNLF